MQMERWKMAEVQCRSLLVTERRTVRTIATPRHSPFISRHRQMKNHCESATSVCINITKPQRRQSRRGREREWERLGERGQSECPSKAIKRLTNKPVSQNFDLFLVIIIYSFSLSFLLVLSFLPFSLLLSLSLTHMRTQDSHSENRC